MKGLAREREGWRRRVSTVTGVRLFVALVFLAGAATPQVRQTAPAFERREFVLHDFRMESGVYVRKELFYFLIWGDNPRRQRPNAQAAPYRGKWLTVLDDFRNWLIAVE
jgi:hypothetical protein